MARPAERRASALGPTPSHASPQRSDSTRRPGSDRSKLRRRGLLALLPLASLQLGADTTGCRSESSDVVRQDRVWTGYWAFHDVGGDTTDLRATFRLGSDTGTPLVLEPPARASFRGQDLVFDPVWDWHATRLSGRVETGDVRYVNVDGDTFVASLRPFREARVPSSFPGAIEEDRSVSFAWDGPPLTAGEVVEVSVAARDNRLAFHSFFESREGATEIVLDANGLGRIPRGPAVLVVRRSSSTDLSDHPGVGGRLTMTWQSRERAVELR